MKDNNKILLEIMTDRNLTPEQVAKLLNRQRQTIYQWRAGVQPMPAHLLELLQFKLQAGAATV